MISLHDYASAPAVYKNGGREEHDSPAGTRRAFIPAPGGRKCVVLPVECFQTASLKRQDVASFAEALCRNFSGWSAFPPLVGFEEDEDGDAQPVFEYPEDDRDRRDTVRSAVGSGRNAFELKPGQVLLPVFSARGAPPEGFLDRLGAFVDDLRGPVRDRDGVAVRRVDPRIGGLSSDVRGLAPDCGGGLGGPLGEEKGGGIARSGALDE